MVATLTIGALHSLSSSEAPFTTGFDCISVPITSLFVEAKTLVHLSSFPGATSGIQSMYFDMG